MAVKIIDFKNIIGQATNITNIIIKDYTEVISTTKESYIMDTAKLSIKNSTTKDFITDISITTKLINLQLDSLPRSSIVYFLKIIII